MVNTTLIQRGLQAVDRAGVYDLSNTCYSERHTRKEYFSSFFFPAALPWLKSRRESRVAASGLTSFLPRPQVRLLTCFGLLLAVVNHHFLCLQKNSGPILIQNCSRFYGTQMQNMFYTEGQGH